MSTRAMGLEYPSLSPADAHDEGCRQLFCDVIELAKRDAMRGNWDAICFFANSNSPFWDYCALLGLDARFIASKILWERWFQ